MKFIDEVVIEAKAGKGGAGSRSFRREAMVPMGGPDGGDGGAGGSVIIVADRNKQTLLDFSYQPQWHARNGESGHGARKSGKAGEDLIIVVPVGTQVFSQSDDSLIVDLNEHEARYVLCKGGRGGKGNDFFKTSTNQAPEYAQPGEEGEQASVRLVLKLVADVGLIGFPNAGKSTLISRISAAKPKIADYPFTTLVPNLGVVKAGPGRSFVVADIPGLIEGASEGKGLGIQFLKHVERTRALAHLIDGSLLLEEGGIEKVIDNYEIIRRELSSYSSYLESRKELVLITKIDGLYDRESLATVLNYFQQKNIPVLAISSISGEGIPECIEKLFAMQKELVVIEGS